MAQIKGNTGRVIETPGYHIRPEFDMPKLRDRLYGNKARSTNVVLPLASMIDMFSVLVIFLILNFSATGEVFFVNKDIKLPEANNGSALEGLPLISISDKNVSLDAEIVGENPLSIEEADYNLPKLRASLTRIRAIQETINPGKKWEGRVNLQADQDTAVIYVKRVMNTLISSGWTNINFAVQPTEQR